MGLVEEQGICGDVYLCLVLLQVPKCFVPVQIFWASPKIFGLAQKIWTSLKHFGTCKRTRHKIGFYSAPKLEPGTPMTTKTIYDFYIAQWGKILGFFDKRNANYQSLWNPKFVMLWKFSKIQIFREACKNLKKKSPDFIWHYLEG